MTTDSWFTVRSLYNIRAVDDEDSHCDHDFDDYLKIEERVVLVRAHTREHAEAQAEEEAHEFVRFFDRGYNPCDQTLRVQLLGLSPPFPILGSELAAGGEVFGDLFVVRGLSLDEIADRWLRGGDHWGGEALDHFRDLRNEWRVFQYFQQWREQQDEEG